MGEKFLPDASVFFPLTNDLALKRFRVQQMPLQLSAVQRDHYLEVESKTLQAPLEP